MKPLLACLCALNLLCGSVAADAKPNVVLILADDLGWTDLACYGSDCTRPRHSINSRATA